MSIATNIRRYREQANMYQSDLGKALGVSAQAVSKWELGKAEPDSDSIMKMCQLFGVTADQLLGIGATPEADEAWQLREQLRRDPSMRLLFDTAKKATPDQIRAAAAMLKALRNDDEIQAD